jgi:hypothetical protein
VVRFDHTHDAMHTRIASWQGFACSAEGGGGTPMNVAGTILFQSSTSMCRSPISAAGNSRGCENIAEYRFGWCGVFKDFLPMVALT